MKTRINSKAGKTINILDRACQNASKIVDELSINPSLKSRIWMDIEKKITSVNKKILSWFLISTASISILVASTVLINSHDYNPKKPKKNSSLTNSNLPNTSYETVIDLETSYTSHITSLLHKQINTESEPLKHTSTIEIPVHEVNETIKVTKIVPIKSSLSSSVVSSMTLGRNISILPEIELDYKIYNNVKENKIISIYLGLSAAISNSKSGIINEQQKNYLSSTNYFSNISFKVENTLKESIWNGKISYLLNKNKNSILEKNTVRLSLQRNINKHVKIGPELIMTNNFKSYYPGFSITVDT